MASDTPAMWTGSSAASKSTIRSHSVSPGVADVCVGVGWGGVGRLPAQPLTGALRERFSANEACREE